MEENQWDGTERRAGPDPRAIQAELKAVRNDVGRLAGAVATLGSDERMQQVIDSVMEEEKRHRQRILTKVVVGLVVVAVIGIFQIGLTNQVKGTADDAKSAAQDAAAVSRYVDHCLVHPSLATPGECGNTTATGQQSATVLALFCYLELPQEQRNETTAKTCFTSAAAQAKAASAAVTTTTTSKGNG